MCNFYVIFITKKIRGFVAKKQKITLEIYKSTKTPWYLLAIHNTFYLLNRKLIWTILQVSTFKILVRPLGIVSKFGY